MTTTGQFSHAAHELTWTAQGTLRVRAGGSTWPVDSLHALWLPAAVPHTVEPSADALALPVWFDADDWPSPWPGPRAILRTAELDRLVRVIAQPGLNPPAAIAAARTTLHDLVAQPVCGNLRLPSDRGARLVAEALVLDPGRGETLEEWGQLVHVSAKTLQRAFAAQAGLHFPRWRAELRLSTANSLLNGGETVQSTARRVGYASTSAFIVAYRRRYGVAPGEDASAA
ncbi:MAG: AraC family transcriptional regulator [Propionicimonas sp.]|nr:AraC family transcriptional regulator [Propionicimonas sp.]